MKQVLFSLVFWVFLFLSPAWVMAEEHQSARGGQVQAAGPYNLELVAMDGQLELYVTDRTHKVVQTSGGSAKANIFYDDGKRVTVQLKPVYGNLMRGTGDFKIIPDTKISVLLALDAKNTYVARFSPKVEPVSESGQTTESDEDHNHEDASENKSYDED